MGAWSVTQTMSIMAAMLHVVYECDVTKVPRRRSGTSGLYERGPQRPVVISVAWHGAV